MRLFLFRRYRFLAKKMLYLKTGNQVRVKIDCTHLTRFDCIIRIVRLVKCKHILFDFKKPLNKTFENVQQTIQYYVMALRKLIGLSLFWLGQNYSDQEEISRPPV